MPSGRPHSVKFSTKTYELIAKIVREHEAAVHPNGTPIPTSGMTLATRFADALERDNPLFDRRLFMAKCDSNHPNGDNHR